MNLPKTIKVGAHIYQRADAVKTANRFQSDDVERAKNYLRGVVIVGGEGTIDLSSKDEVWIGVVHDNSGYNPMGAVAVNQNRFHSHPDIPLQTADEILTDLLMEDTEYVEELQEEWGDEWYEILTEGINGMVFGPFTPEVAADIIRSDKRAASFIDIEEAEEDEYDEDY